MQRPWRSLRSLGAFVSNVDRSFDISAFARFFARISCLQLVFLNLILVSMSCCLRPIYVVRHLLLNCRVLQNVYQ